MKKLLTFLMFFLLATAMAQMQAETKTVSMSSFSELSGYVGGDTNVSYGAAQGNAGNAPIVNSGQIRVYQGGGLFTVSAKNGVTIKKIVLGSAMATKVSIKVDDKAFDDGANYTISANGSVTINLSATESVQFTCNGTDKNSRLYVNYLAVSYETAAPATPHTVTLGDDNTILTESAAGAGVTLPSRSNVGDYAFVGWSISNYTTESTTVPTIIEAGNYNPTKDITLYPMYKRTGEGQEAALSQTLQYDTWTYSGSTSNKTSYRLFGNGAYVESESFDLSKMAKVVVYGGTYGGDSYNKLTIGDGTHTWKSVNVSGSSQTGNNTYTNGNALSGTGKLRITSNSGNGTSNGVRISKVEIYTLGSVDYYISTPVAPVVKTATTTAFSAEAKAGVTKTVGDADFTEAATLTPAGAGSLAYSSSDTKVATVNAATGLVHIVAAGNTTIKAEFTGNDDYEASSDSYALTVNAATLTSIAIGGTPAKTAYTVGETFSTEGLTVTGTYSDGNTAPITEGITWTFEPATLAATTTSVTATATVGGKSASQTFDVTVSKKAASVAIENVEVEVGKTATISATTTPADAALTYTVTEGADKISIADGVITGVAEGTATVKAAFAGNDEYNTAETTFSVTVTPKRLVAFINLATTEDISGTTTTDLITWEKDGFVVTNEKGTGTVNVDNYYPGSSTPRNQTRFYGGHVLTFTPADGTAITKIEYVATTTGYATTMAGSEWTNATASANGTTVTITPAEGTEAVVANIGGTNGGTSFTIYYEDATPVVRTLKSIAISDYKTEFKQGDKFEFGGKVMASYEEDGVADRNVTGQATFSGYDMNVAGTQTVTVSYTEKDVTKTANYDINVEEVLMFKVIVAQPTGGTFVVKNNATNEVVNSGDMLPEGTVLKVEANPAEGYAYNYWQVYTDHHTITKYDGHQTETYKLDKDNIEEEARAVFSASFHKVGNIVYSWSANGKVTTDTYEVGETVVAPANPANITVKEGEEDVTKVFVGWVTTSTVNASTAPEYVTDFGTAQENKMYFAVYATATQGTGGTGDYYEKVPNTYTDWLNGEYLLVYETGTNNKVNVFNAASGTNFVETTVQDNKIYATNTMATIKMVKDLKSDGETPCAWTHVMVKKVAENSYSQYIYNEGSGKTFLYITADAAANLKDTFHQSKYAISISWDTANNRWKATLNGKYIGYSTSSSDFRLNENSNTTNKPIQFYVKKAGVTYSAFTTGDAFKGEFKLVTSAGDLVEGREYIIVSKHAAGNYGLSIDAADSRQNTKYDDNGKELPSTGSKTNNDFRRAEQDVTLFNGDEYASINGKTSVLTLGGAAGAWKFNSAAGYLAMNGDRACLNVTTAPADDAELTNIAIDANHKVVIKFNNYPGTEGSYRYIFLNFNEGYPRFAAYGAGSNGWTYGKDVYLYWRVAPNKETLAEIEANGLDGTEYTVIDDLVVHHVKGNTAWAHDMAKSYAYRENTYDATWYGGYNADSYTQHNWVMLTFPEGTDMNKVVNQQLSNVNGTYHGHKGVSHKIVVSSFDNAAIERENIVRANTYNMASFWDDNTYDYVTVLGKNFFFMNPKIEEVCHITEAVWNGTGFVVPANQTVEEVHLNSGDLKGGVKVNWDFNVSGDQSSALNRKLDEGYDSNNRYKFDAVVTKKPAPAAVSAGAPAKVAPSNCGLTDYVVYPLDFTVTNNIVTEVKDVDVAGREVKSVRFYDIAGRARSEAQPGINIVVTEYTDGTHSTAKMVR